MSDDIQFAMKTEATVAIITAKVTAEILAATAELGKDGIDKLMSIHLENKQEMNLSELSKYSQDAPQICEIPEASFEPRFMTKNKNAEHKPFSQLTQEEKISLKTFSEMSDREQRDFLLAHKNDLPEGFLTLDKRSQNDALASISDSYPSRFGAFCENNHMHFSQVAGLELTDNLVPIAFASQDLSFAAEFTKNELRWEMTSAATRNIPPAKAYEAKPVGTGTHKGELFAADHNFTVERNPKPATHKGVLKALPSPSIKS